MIAVLGSRTGMLILLIFTGQLLLLFCRGGRVRRAKFMCYGIRVAFWCLGCSSGDLLFFRGYGCKAWSSECALFGDDRFYCGDYFNFLRSEDIKEAYTKRAWVLTRAVFSFQANDECHEGKVSRRCYSCSSFT